eukprot:4070835-Amphidinium_carterae.1
MTETSRAPTVVRAQIHQTDALETYACTPHKSKRLQHPGTRNNSTCGGARMTTALQACHGYVVRVDKMDTTLAFTAIQL